MCGITWVHTPLLEDEMPDVVPLWPDGAPGSAHWTQQEKDYTFTEPWPHRITRNVTNPTLTISLPDPAMATGAGVIVCPGGAHHFLAVDHEGADVARWLNARGIAAFVLKYRVIATPDDDAEFLEARANIPARMRDLLPAHWPLALADGQRAVRMVRERAAEYGVRPDRVGIMGFSAGGHLAGGVALANEPGSRPDFVAPIYGARLEEIVVPADAPPLFTAVASNDPIAVRSCVTIYSAWQAAGRQAEIHCYAQGGHGFGMVAQGLPSDGWIDRLYEWMGAQGLLARA
jgi:acetyl esterase/lipase